MRLSTPFVVLATSLLAFAAPIKRTANPNDLLVLKFAHVLEQLETQFYTQAIAKFQESDFVSAGFTDSQVPIEQFTAIQIDESTHTTILESTIISLGDTPINTCQFNFDSVLTDVATMAATARVVENLGVSAYLGAAHLISDPVILTAAATILTVEARHQSVLNILNVGTAIPQAFDIALTPNEVLAVASQFVSGCDLGVVANPTLSVTNTGSVGPGTGLTFSSPAMSGSTSGMFCQMLVGGAPFAIVLPIESCVVPQGINGPVAIFVTSDSQPLNNNVRDQATDKVVAGPVVVFIDIQIEIIGQLARGGSSGSSGASVSTQTITPAEASAVVSSISAAATGTSAANAVAAAPSAADSASAAAATTLSVDASATSPAVAAAAATPAASAASGNSAISVSGWSSVSA
ncbi:ferritin-like domain-containing protein [Abortiporus biennis]|nr:ferritin-like domain-containing protein [Abortiporus biennis]